MVNIEHELFGKTPEGRVIDKYIITNQKGISVILISFGATLISLKMPDKNGKIGEVTLGLDTLQEYLLNKYYFGATIGRFANRIAKGIFLLDGREYNLACNEKSQNHLHGGNRGFDKVIWNAVSFNNNSSGGVRFSYVSPDGEEGYPGNLNTVTTYTLNEDNELKIEYFAETDKATIVNLTNHTYWNLSGAITETGLKHELTLNCSKYLPVDNNLIPTGEIKNVFGTPMDFTKPKMIGRDIDDIDGGYDHCFIVDPEKQAPVFAARLYSPISGRTMEIYTTKPGIQFYSGNNIDGLTGANEVFFQKYSGLCLETEFYPNSINEKSFPSPILYPDKDYHHTTIYHFFID